MFSQPFEILHAQKDKVLLVKNKTRVEDYGGWVCSGALSVEDENGRVIKLDPEDETTRTMVANTLLTPSYGER